MASSKVKPQKYCCICNKEILNKNIKYCSAECVKKAKSTYEQKVKDKQRALRSRICTCTICNSKFTTDITNKKYCSIDCYNKATQKIRANIFLQNHIPTLVYCKICKNEFVRTLHNVKYCSDVCRLIDKQNKSKPEFIQKKCIVCNNTFETRSRNSLCCSELCHKKYRVIKQMEYLKKKDVDKIKLREQKEIERRRQIEQDEIQRRKIQEQINQDRLRQNLEILKVKLKFHKYMIDQLNFYFKNNEYETIINMIEHFVKTKLKKSICINENTLKNINNADELNKYIIIVMSNDATNLIF